MSKTFIGAAVSPSQQRYGTEAEVIKLVSRPWGRYCDGCGKLMRPPLHNSPEL